MFKWGLGIVLLPCLIYQVLDILVPPLSFFTFYNVSDRPGVFYCAECMKNFIIIVLLKHICSIYSSQTCTHQLALMVPSQMYKLSMKSVLMTTRHTFTNADNKLAGPFSAASMGQVPEKVADSISCSFLSLFCLCTLKFESKFWTMLTNNGFQTSSC